SPRAISCPAAAEKEPFNRAQSRRRVGRRRAAERFSVAAVARRGQQAHKAVTDRPIGTARHVPISVPPRRVPAAGWLPSAGVALLKGTIAFPRAGGTPIPPIDPWGNLATISGEPPRAAPLRSLAKTATAIAEDPFQLRRAAQPRGPWRLAMVAISAQLSRSRGALASAAAITWSVYVSAKRGVPHGRMSRVLQGLGRRMGANVSACLAFPKPVPCTTFPSLVLARAQRRPPVTFKLPELPYPYDALAPYMSAETLQFHHDKHHQAYVDNGNKVAGPGTKYEGKSIEDICKAAFT